MPAITNAFLAVLALVALPRATCDHSIPKEFKAKYVIHVVADGLMPTKVTADLENLPNFRRLRREGAFTDNARNEKDSSQTTPNHVSMLTGLSIEGHGYKEDADNGKRVKQTSIFDLVWDAGMKTCMYSSKDKFKLFDRSWPIDVHVFEKDTNSLTNKYISEMKGSSPCSYALVHWKDADSAGHYMKGSDNNSYKEAVRRVDEKLGRVFDMIDESERFRKKTAIILTADHGFGASNHAEKGLRGNYQIPFYVWGPGVQAGSNLYKLNPKTRKDPGEARPDNNGLQPIRCHDSGVLAADYLGVESSSGRFSNLDLAVGVWMWGTIPILLSPLPSPPTQTPSRLRSPMPTPSPKPAPTASPKSAPTPAPTPAPLMQPAAEKPAPTSPAQPEPPTSLALSLYEFTGLSIIRAPDTPSGISSTRVGEIQIPPWPAVAIATQKVKTNGNLPLEGMDEIRLTALVGLSSSPKGKIVFHMTIRTDSGMTVRGREMTLTGEASKSYVQYDEIIAISGAGKTITQVRLKLRNLTQGKPEQTGYVSSVQLEGVSR